MGNCNEIGEGKNSPSSVFGLMPREAAKGERHGKGNIKMFSGGLYAERGLKHGDDGCRKEKNGISERRGQTLLGKEISGSSFFFGSRKCKKSAGGSSKEEDLGVSDR